MPSEGDGEPLQLVGNHLDPKDLGGLRRPLPLHPVRGRGRGHGERVGVVLGAVRGVGPRSGGQFDPHARHCNDRLHRRSAAGRRCAAGNVEKFTTGCASITRLEKFTGRPKLEGAVPLYSDNNP